MNYEQILYEYFGYPSFRGIQKEIVESIGAGKDTLGLMPTGGGKSVTFQVPALSMEGVCIVITPLISLMKDQVTHLRDRGILAAYVNSSMSYDEIQKTYDNAIFGGVKFLYVSPERLSTSLFLTKLNYMKVCFIAVDEAHCISQWGYDFRPSYLQISKIREKLPDVPILALTATATPEVVDDIQEQLLFREKNVFKMSFKRENLIYVVRPAFDKTEELMHILRSVKGSAIVYTRSRTRTKEISKLLNDNGISATFYHAGLDFAVKDQRQQEWQEDNIRVMVATNAFGMGIDKPDVRLVVHVDCPDSLEAYFQEAGRAGRDGKKSFAVLLRTNAEKRQLLDHVRKAFPTKEYIKQLYEHLAYFFQLAVNTGVGASYEFNIERFCVTFNHFPSRVENALQILQRAGYIKYDPEADGSPRVMFLISREHLYRLKEVSVGEDMVITSLLRKYGSLFSDLTYINIGTIAQMSQFDEDKVEAILKDLSHRGILKFVPKRAIPRITYVQQRVETERLHIEKDVYETLQERALKRVEAVIHYLETDNECRQVMLLKYFGEKAEQCGMCDVCLALKAEKNQDAELNVCKIIERKIKNGEITFVYELRQLECPREELTNAINTLRENGHLLPEGIKLRWKD